MDCFLYDNSIRLERVKWLETLLKKRQQRAKVNGHLSDWT